MNWLFLFNEEFCFIADDKLVIGNTSNYLRIQNDINELPIVEILTNGGDSISWIEFIESDTLLVVCFNND